MSDFKKKVKILCNHLKIDIKGLSKESKISYNTLISINLGLRHPGAATLRSLDKCISRLKPGYNLNYLFFDQDMDTPFVKGTEDQSIVKKPSIIKVDNTKTINERMVEVRKKLGLSQSEFALKLDYNKANLQSIEYNRMVPNIELLRKLRHRGFIGSYEEFLDGSQSSNQLQVEELNNKVHNLELKIRELEDDIQMYKSMIKQRLS